MNGYQPKKTCDNCTERVLCDKAKDGKRACKKYEQWQPSPPKSGSCVTPPKTLPAPPRKTSRTKQRTVLSVRDFAILYNLVNDKVQRCEIYAEDAAQTYLEGQSDQSLGRLFYIDEAKKKRFLEENHDYQDLLRIRDKLGELNIEVETPIVEAEE